MRWSAPFKLIFLCAMVFLLLNNFAQSQQPEDRTRTRERLIAAELEKKGLTPGISDEGEDLSQDLELDLGGFFRYSYYDFDDGEDQHILRTADLRLWGNAVYKDAHQIYVRVMGDIQNYNSGSNYFYQEQDDDNYPRLDVGYYRVDLTRALGLEEMGQLRIKGGRDFFTAGSGMVLDRRGEGGHLEYKLDSFTLTGFIMRSVPSEDSPDRTHPNFGHDKRIFSGLQIGHSFSPELELYGFTVAERYNNRKEFASTTQKFGNDSTFYGIGMRGQYGPNWTYTGEYALERGFRYPDTWREKSDVEAFGFNVETEYTFRQIETRPKLSAQYIYGSGDQDAGNTLDTVGGNQGGTDYNAFNSYGYINTGLAFFMRQSNIRVIRLGTGFCPLEKSEGCDNLELGVSVFDYRRVKSMGGISDRFVNPGVSFLGREVDFIATWRPFSDVSIMGQYGVFRPHGKAFPDDAYRYYFSVGTVIFF